MKNICITKNINRTTNIQQKIEQQITIQLILNRKIKNILSSKRVSNNSNSD